MYSKSITSCYNEYINTFGEIEGFVGSQEYDHIVVAGDFNVDFDRGGPIATLLGEFVSELGLIVCDLP